MCAKTHVMQNLDDLHWDDLRTVLALMRYGTLAQAGAHLGVNYTTVARRITRVEQALDMPVFERTSDGYRPTEVAHLIAAKAGEMETAADTLLRQLSGRDQKLRGPLTVTAPQLLIAHVLAPALQEFSKRYPDIQLKLRASNDLLDLNRREADVALRISRDPGDTLMGRRLVDQSSASFASAAYADQITARPEDPVDWLVYEAMSELPAHVRLHHPQSRILMVFDDMVAMAGAAQAGMGVVRMPVFLGHALGLRQINLLPPQPYPEIWLVAHRDLWSSAKVAAFREVIVPFFKAERHRFV